MSRLPYRTNIVLRTVLKNGKDSSTAHPGGHFFQKRFHRAQQNSIPNYGAIGVVAQSFLGLAILTAEPTVGRVLPFPSGSPPRCSIALELWTLQGKR